MQRIVVIGTGFAGMCTALSAKCVIELNVGEDVGIEMTVVPPEPKLVVRPRVAFQREIGTSCLVKWGLWLLYR